MKYIHARHVVTGEKRRIPAKWMQPNVFGQSWTEHTPRTRKGKGQPVESPEATSDEVAFPIAPANGDTPRKDQ